MAMFLGRANKGQGVGQVEGPCEGGGKSKTGANVDFWCRRQVERAVWVMSDDRTA